MTAAGVARTAAHLLRRRYTWLWLIWLLMFAAIEGSALADKRAGDTLTEHVRSWASVGTKSRGWRFRRFALLAFLAWLAVHFLTGGRPKDTDGDGQADDTEPGFV